MTDSSHKEDSKRSHEPYESLNVDRLLVYCVQRVLANKEECTLDRLIYECFTLFPKKFSLLRYPQWPDAVRVYRSIRRLYSPDHGWITGLPQRGFKITPAGRRVAAEVEQLLTAKDGLHRPPKTTRSRGKEEAVLHYIRKNDLFRRWSADPSRFAPRDSELRNLLNGTLETPPRILGQNLDYYAQVADLLEDRDVGAFLAECRAQHKELLTGG
jgi:hypothetical protein